MPERHQAQAIAHEADGPERIRCACGWESDPQAIEDEASQQFRRHLAAVGGAEPTA